jgi:hypothetical protein
MFGHDDDNGQHKQDDKALSASVTAPTDPAAGSSLGLGNEAAADTSAPAIDHGVGSFIMDPVPSVAGAQHAGAGGTASPVNDDLIKLKQDALQQLSPLVGHLDQTPEEKFRTTMMMIQASDDQSLLKTAYDAAKQITDEKARAQALLDVVNEINYFTQQHKNGDK